MNLSAIAWHTERITCPSCHQPTTATVVHTWPWWSYVHTCECGAVILESEWELAPGALAFVSRRSDGNPLDRPQAGDKGDMKPHPGLPPAMIETAAGSVMVQAGGGEVKLSIALGRPDDPAELQHEPRSVMLVLELWQVYQLARLLRERALAEGR